MTGKKKKKIQIKDVSGYYIIGEHFLNVNIECHS